MKIIKFEDKYRDDLIFMVLSAKNAIGRIPRINEELLDMLKDLKVKITIVSSNIDDILVSKYTSQYKNASFLKSPLLVLLNFAIVFFVYISFTSDFYDFFPSTNLGFCLFFFL